MHKYNQWFSEDMRYAASWPQRAEKEQKDALGGAGEGICSKWLSAQLSEDWKRIYLRLHVVHVHKGAWARRVWETKKRHDEENAPQFINTKRSLSNEYTWCLKWQQKSSCILFCEINYSQTVGNRTFHDFISYMYTLLTVNPFHIVIPFIHKIMFQCRVSIIPSFTSKETWTWRLSQLHCEQKAKGVGLKKIKRLVRREGKWVGETMDVYYVY